MDPPVYNPAIPFTNVIMGGFNAGRMLKVQGQAHPSARCFAVNLQCGPNVNPRDDIALHLSPVFTAPPRLVRNSLQGQMWGPEESYGAFFPFSVGQNYEILILAEADRFKIAINGQHFAEFTYRVPSQRITHLAIDGDTMISLIEFSGTVSPTPGYGTGMPYGATSPSFPGVPPIPQVPPVPTAGYNYGQPPFPGPQPGYPQQMGGYPQPNAYPMQQGYPTQQGYPGQAYPHSPNTAHKGGLGTALAGGLGGAALGAGVSSLLSGGHKSHHKGGLPGVLGSLPLASGILGGHHGHKHKSSKAIPIGLGVGAAALAGAAMIGHNPLKPKKLKKLYKHKHFKHKHKHGWGFHGRSSSSSSSD